MTSGYEAGLEGSILFDDSVVRFKATENCDAMETPVSVIKPKPIDWIMVQCMCVYSS